MGDLNRASIFGRLGKDPEIRSTQSGEKVANFSLATTDQWKEKQTGEKKERTEWHNIIVWGSLVSIVESHLKKGNRVYVEGEIRTRKWQDKNGNDRFSTEIVLNGFNARLNIIDWPDDRKINEHPTGGYDQSPENHQRNDGYGAGGQPSANHSDEIPFFMEWRV